MTFFLVHYNILSYDNLSYDRGSEFMPTKTFLNLPREKQDKLIQSAIEEFLTMDYMQVSINKIINRVHIPRGSFYMYFDGKEDLFEYVLCSFQDKFIQIVKQTFLENQGDLRKTFIQLFDKISREIYKNNYKIFFHNFFVFLNTKKGIPPNPAEVVFDQVKDIIHSDIAVEDLKFIFDIFLHHLFTSLADTLKNQNIEENKKKYLRKINIICYGIYNERK